LYHVGIEAMVNGVPIRPTNSQTMIEIKSLNRFFINFQYIKLEKILHAKEDYLQFAWTFRRMW